MSYDYGRFVWFELHTKDIDKAKAFYLETLPWQVQSMPMEAGGDYDMISLGETGIGGFFSPPVEMPASWVSYVSVADVDATAAKVEAAGGATHEAFDVPGVGRMQPVSDPHGGAFFLFKAETADPSQVEGPGSFHWNELWTQEPEASLEFYENALGYTHQAYPMPHGTYYVFQDGDDARGGVTKAPSSDIPTMWLQYVTVDDCDSALERARQNGATPMGEPMDADGVGRFAIFRDPLGGMMGVIKPSQS